MVRTSAWVKIAAQSAAVASGMNSRSAEVSWASSANTMNGPACTRPRLGAERDQPTPLGLDLLARALAEALEDVDRPVGAPGSGHLAVDEKRADRLRHLRVEDLRAVLLGQDQRAPCMREQDGVPGRQEAHRCGGVGAGQRQILEVEQLGPVLGREAPERQAVQRGLDLLRSEAGPVGDLGL